MMKRSIFIFTATLFFAGCGEMTLTFPERSEPKPVVELSTEHKPDECGRISGSVTWVGEVPGVPQLTVDTKDGPKPVPNPNAPRIQAGTKRFAGAVVFLRGIDPAKAKPWTRPKDATVLVNDFGITFPETGHAGFVRHGDSIQFTSFSDTAQVVRGRGAMNFAVPIRSKQEPSQRIANRPGRIELTSGSNVAAAMAHLFVCEHPYYEITNERGEFRFDAVPEGNYELVVWHPNWKIAGHDRNPETGLICRYWYGKPLETVVSVNVK